MNSNSWSSVSGASSHVNASAELNALEHSKLLNELKWTPRSDNCLEYIEATHYERLQNCEPNINFLTGSLREQDLPDWLQRRGSFRPKILEHGHGPLKGGFRLLFCERSQGYPPTIACSESSFRHILQSFNLAPETTPSLVQLLGSYGTHWINQSENPLGIQIIIKAFQKGELGNWTISLNHDFKTSHTDALAVWTAYTSKEHISLDRHWKTRLHHITAQLQAVVGLWTHPTCLPLVFLQNYIVRTMYRCNMANEELVQLDVALGVNQAGRMVGNHGLAADWPTNVDFKHLTIGLHSATNSLVFVQQGARWARRCLEFIIQLETELEAKAVPTSAVCLSTREAQGYILSVIQGVEDSFEALKSRAQGATSVLFNASSQRDSLLNVRIAASTKEDSISMKTFTFLTALFLPGTFIATLLSASMIQWLPNEGGNTDTTAAESPEASSPGIIVSGYYWIYWVVTIPVTVLVMFGWFLWYRHANRQWLNQAGLPNMLRQ